MVPALLAIVGEQIFGLALGRTENSRKTHSVKILKEVIGLLSRHMVVFKDDIIPENR